MDGVSQIVKVRRSTDVYRNMRDSSMISKYYKMNAERMLAYRDVEGASPTDIFIGRYGYPKVFAGPMVPREFGNTSLLSSPEMWRSMSISEIFAIRFKLVRGMFVTDVKRFGEDRRMDSITELAMADKPVDSEMRLAKVSQYKKDKHDVVEPFGFSGILSDMQISNVSTDRKLESRYEDTDMHASDAVIDLYGRGVNVSKISRALSAGMFGAGKHRRLVPTRWSITAVDDTVSKSILSRVKYMDTIDHIEIYRHVSLDNRWMIIVMPGTWEYESIEAWYPNTTWNENPNEVSIFSSAEGFEGKKGYAEIGGCYYAARLAVAEKLSKKKVQGRVLILREVHDGYVMPVGVWNVREHVREALEGQPIVANESDILGLVSKMFDISAKEWTKNSVILKKLFLQRRITAYL